MENTIVYWGYIGNNGTIETNLCLGVSLGMHGTEVMGFSNLPKSGVPNIDPIILSSLLLEASI